MSKTWDKDSVQQEITEQTLLLDNRGRLVKKGYATQMNFVYNRKNVHSFPLKLKEWNFYQFIKDRWSLQMTIGHVSYCCSVSVTLIDLQNGKRYEAGTMKLFHVPKLDCDPQSPSVNQFYAKDFCMRFEVTDTQRILTFTGKNKQYKCINVQLSVPNCATNPKMVIATPFVKPTQFYLNYKENYFGATGFARFDDLDVNLDGACGLVDWGRGVWPYSHEWYWGNLSAQIEGVPFGFNIGWGFGDLSHASENIFFYNGKAYKLGHLNVEKDDADCMRPWTLSCDKMQLRFTPFFDNYTQNKLVVVNTYCHQVYGTFDGSIQTDEGEVRFSDLTAFIEHAVNRW